MDKIDQIREHMPVKCSNGDECGLVDKVEGEYVKLTKDDYGDHHWFPVEWVSKVDAHVHLSHPRDYVMREWRGFAPPQTQTWQRGESGQTTAN